MSRTDIGSQRPPRVTEAEASGTAFVGAHLIDGTGSPPLADSAIVVRGGRIVSVGAASDLDSRGDLRVVEVAGKWVIPGLLDANVHLVFHCEPEILLRYEPGRYDDLVLEAAQVALKAGVTTVFDTWGPLESLIRVRDRINAGEVTASRIFCAGNIIGNGGPWSDDFFPRDCLSSAVVDSVNHHWEQGVGADLTWMSADDVREAVRNYIATSGIDFVKYAANAHASFRFIALSPDAQRAIVEEAHDAGMIAQACTLTPEGLKLAIAAGVDLLQHGDMTGRRPMPQETLDLVVARQLPCVVMPYTERYVAATRENLQHRDHWRDTVIVKDGNERNLIKAGARLMLATDSGLFAPTVTTSPWLGASFSAPDVPIRIGSAHLLWLQAAIERDMKPMDALLSATRNIAQAYGQDDELGTIERGKQADLLVLDGNPLDDVANYGRIAHVVQGGKLVDRTRLPEHPVLTAMPRP